MKKYVIIGSSIAGLNGIDVLRQLDKEAQIVLISEEKDIYSKCIMHFYMKGERSRERLSFVSDSFMEDNRVIWKRGVRAEKIDTVKKQILLNDGTKESYDSLLITTGSHAMIPPISRIENAKNVYAFHSLDDCERIMENAKDFSNIVILGTGLVGVDVANGLPDAPDDTYSVETREEKDGSYQKIIHKDGKIYGVILQRDLCYAGVLNQLIAMKPDLTKVVKSLFELDYADMLLLDPGITMA